MDATPSLLRSAPRAADRRGACAPRVSPVGRGRTGPRDSRRTRRGRRSSRADTPTARGPEARRRRRRDSCRAPSSHAASIAFSTAWPRSKAMLSRSDTSSARGVRNAIAAAAPRDVIHVVAGSRELLEPVSLATHDEGPSLLVHRARCEGGRRHDPIEVLRRDRPVVVSPHVASRPDRVPGLHAVAEATPPAVPPSGHHVCRLRPASLQSGPTWRTDPT